MNIIDVRYLLSALIQILPTVFSISLISISIIDKRKIKKHLKLIIMGAFLTLFTIGANTALLLRLTENINDELLIISASVISYVVIAMILIYTIIILSEFDKQKIKSARKK